MEHAAIVLVKFGFLVFTIAWAIDMDPQLPGARTNPMPKQLS